MALYAANEQKNYLGMAFAMYTYVKMDAILPTIINIKLLINLILKSPLISHQNFS